MTLLKVSNWCWINPKGSAVRFSYQPDYLLENLKDSYSTFLRTVLRSKYGKNSATEEFAARKLSAVWIQLLRGQSKRHAWRKLTDKIKPVFPNFRVESLMSFRGFWGFFWCWLLFVNCQNAGPSLQMKKWFTLNKIKCTSIKYSALCLQKSLPNFCI